jgi:hypothetical protein
VYAFVGRGVRIWKPLVEQRYLQSALRGVFFFPTGETTK